MQDDPERTDTSPGVRPAPRAPVVVSAVALGTGVGLVFPVLARFQDLYGFSELGLGLISAASFLSALVAGLFLAQLADRGRARVLLVGGLAASALGLIGFAMGDRLWHFLAARILEGLGAGVFFPAARRVVTVGAPSEAGHNLGILAAAEHGGFLLGPAVAAVVAEAFTLSAPFWVVGALQLVLCVWLAFVPIHGQRVQVSSMEASTRPLGSFGRSLLLARRRTVAGAALLCLALFIPMGVYDSLWSRYLTDRGATTALIGLGLSLYALPGVLLAPTGGRLADRYGPVRSATVAVIALVPIVALYGLVTAPLVITVVAVIEAFPQALAGPSVQVAMVRASGVDDISAGQGLATAVEQIGAAVAALAAPIVYGIWGSAVVFVGTALIVAVVFAVGVVVGRSPAPQGRAGEVVDL